jgi:hypothetical protein
MKTKVSLGHEIACIHVWKMCTSTDARLGSNMSGPGRQRIPLSPGPLPSPATPSKQPQPPRYEERENFLKSFSYEWLPSLSAGTKGKRRGGDFENCINQVSIHYPRSDSLQGAKCNWVRSYVTLHCRISTQLRNSSDVGLFTYWHAGFVPTVPAIDKHGSDLLCRCSPTDRDESPESCLIHLLTGRIRTNCARYWQAWFRYTVSVFTYWQRRVIWVMLDTPTDRQDSYQLCPLLTSMVQIYCVGVHLLTETSHLSHAWY